MIKHYNASNAQISALYVLEQLKIKNVLNVIRVFTFKIIPVNPVESTVPHVFPMIIVTSVTILLFLMAQYASAITDHI